MQSRACAECSRPFTISKADGQFYSRAALKVGAATLALPPPTRCPDCRWQRRLAFRNERALYKRSCDLTGKSMISMHPGGTPFPVYHITEWQSDRWDACSYGAEFDFSKPFFAQFAALRKRVPHFSLFTDPLMNINSDYTNCASESKNCYLITQAEKNEDCYYSRGINRCRDCCDCLRVNDCELCYEGVNLSGCYRCLFSQDCESSSDCYFSSDLRSCKNCFGCHGLSKKEYYLFNEPLSKDEWTRRVAELPLTTSNIAALRKKSAAVRVSVPKRAVRLLKCENAIGDHLQQCKNAYWCFDSKQLEDCAFCYEVLNGAKNSYDFSMWGIACELLYECNGCGYNAYQLQFSAHCWNNVSFLIYCDSCFPSVKNCFGCFGLRQKEYCILNKQYTKDAYEALIPRIVEHMRKTGEWGEFFPIELSPYAYNESLANEFFPLTKEDATKKGWPWRDEEGGPAAAPGTPRAAPESIQQTTDDICQAPLLCETTARAYKIMKAELALYRKLGVPIPRRAPEVRHRERVSLRNPRKLWERACANCNKQTQSSFPPDTKETVFCEECYLRTVA